MSAADQAAHGASTRQAVLDYLVRAADLDGLVTVAQREIANDLGLNQTTIGKAVRRLAADGVLSIQHDGGGYKSLAAIQLAESVIA